MTISVLLADDQEMVLAGLSMILEADPDIDVVARCVDGVQALEAIRRLGPDVALLDIRMPRLDGLEVCRRAAQLTRVVIVTTFDDDEYVDTALARGAAGFILKDSGPALLRAAVRAAAHGDALISPELTVSLLERTRTRALRTGEPRGSTSMHHLTPRELDVARLVARGRTNAEVAEDLCISVGTVKTHLASVQRRLEARNRVEIASKVWASGLLG